MGNLKTRNTSLLDLIEYSFKHNWKYPAYSDYGSDTSFTYGEVYMHICRLHAIFEDLGIKRTDRIALCDKNSSRWGISMMAIMTYGAVAVPILSDFSPEQIHNIYQHSGSKLMMCGPRLIDEFPDGMDISNFSLASGKNLHPISEFQKVKPSNVNFFRDSANDLALISYTSGSTGRSKGVMLPYRSIWANAVFVDERLSIPMHANIMPLLPMSHMLGFAFEFMYGTLIGAHIHFLTKVPSPKIVLEAFQHIKPIMIVCVPLVIEKIVQTKVFPMLRTPKIKRLLAIPGVRSIVHKQIRNKLLQAFGGNIHGAVIGGAAFNKEVEEFLQKIKFPYTVGYGMTECGPLIAYEGFDKYVKGSCGKVIRRMQVKIDSSDPENVAGEILTKGANVMLGYYKNPEETAEAFDEDHWLHTGDLGTIDKEGNIFIRGRKKTMLLSASGQNVYPEEIEDVILTQTIFEETVVVQRGEKFVALVYISEASMRQKHITQEQLEASLDRYKKVVNQQLPKFAQLSAFELHEEFEKTPKRSVRRYLYK